MTSIGKFQVTSNMKWVNVYTTNANYEHTLIAEYMYSMQLKCLEKLKGRVLPMNTEKSVMSTYVRKWVLFEFKLKISIEILLTPDKIHLQYTFQILQLLCSYCLPSYNSQQMTKMSSIWINARTDMSLNGLWQPVPARLRILWHVSQMLSWRVSSFLIGTEHTWAFVSTNKNLKGRVQNLVGLYLKNC
jgi:hypothetical protein